MVKILFVCTGNMFRSASAEYALKKYILDNKEHIYNLSGFSCSQIQISSAGTNVQLQPMHKEMIKQFKNKNINIFNHIFMQIDQQLIKEFDLIIAMGTNHKKYIKERFKINAPLFNEICYNKKEGILDDYEVLGKRKENDKEEIKYIKYVINYLFESMPYFASNFKNFLK